MSLREELGFGLPYFMESVEVDTLDELMAQPPLFVCATCVKSVSLDVNNQPAKFDAGTDYVFSLRFFLASRANELTGETFFKPSEKKFPDRYRPYKGQDLTGSSLLIWRFGGLGDLMFIQPIIQHLKANYPSCKICLATAHNNIDLLRCWPENLLDMVSLQPFPASLLDKYAYHMTFEGALDRCEEGKILNCYDVFKRVAKADFPFEAHEPQLMVSKRLRENLAPFVPSNTVAVQLRSTSPVRTFPLHKISALVNALGEAGYTAGLIDQRDHAFFIQDTMIEEKVNPKYFVNLSMLSASIPHCVTLLDLCVGSIGVDSSIVHFSAALNKPTLGLYGAFPGDTRMRYYKTGKWIEADGWNDCGMKPCNLQDEPMKCPYVQKDKSAGCLDALDLNEIVRQFSDLERRLKN